MSQRRTLILIAAIAIGALALFLVWQYVNGVQDQAYSDAERVKVYLVKAPIAKGQKIADLIVSTPDTPPQVMPLVAGADVAEAGMFGRLWNGLKSLFG